MKNVVNKERLTNHSPDGVNHANQGATNPSVRLTKTSGDNSSVAKKIPLKHISFVPHSGSKRASAVNSTSRSPETSPVVR